MKDDLSGLSDVDLSKVSGGGGLWWMDPDPKPPTFGERYRFNRKSYGHGRLFSFLDALLP
jgi:hypothetical protein